MKYRQLVPIPEFGANAVCADDVHGQLLGWRDAVAQRGGTLHANSLTRTAVQQQVLRDRYLVYLRAKHDWEEGGKVGAPPKVVAGANKPGRSNHQAGRAIDASTVNAFPKAPADRQVDLLWETGAPFGFTPVIKAPDETAQERWHFDCWNDWRHVKDHLGYEVGCLCAALDVGQAGEWQSDARLLQALLLRTGFDIGEPDGIFGKRSQAAFKLAMTGTSLALKYTWDTDGVPVVIDATGVRVDLLADALRRMPATPKWVRP